MSWPKRHLRRCGVFWQIHSAIAMCKKVNNDDYWNKCANTNPNSPYKLGPKYWTDHEVAEFAIIDKKLKDLYANRFTAYKEMVKEEHINKNN